MALCSGPMVFDVVFKDAKKTALRMSDIRR